MLFFFAAQSRFATQTSIKFCVPSLIIISYLLAPEHLLLHALFIGTIAGYAFEAILASICIRDSLTIPGVRRFSNIVERVSHHCSANGPQWWHPV